MTVPSTARSAALSNISFMPGIGVSPPSRPNFLAVVHLAAKQFSNCVLQIRLFNSVGNCTAGRSGFQYCLKASCIFMVNDVHIFIPDASTVSLLRPDIIDHSICTGRSLDKKPTILHTPVKNSLSRSASVKPYRAGSRSSGILVYSRARGSNLVFVWPLTWLALTSNSRCMLS